ncbi:hypothetical protein [Anaeromassilibacillus senegalensis]|uniref:hypothetical protein n=1 Tax=Anaeromassilibacillus senegalensis TaxID=1673717 RepID=UPI000681B67A|nr:hypothetical protein [Anaeromassilibacillus senegalensis]
MKPKKSAEWRRLDNAAKIFPCTSTKADAKVFRFSCELLEPVDPQALQQALDRAMEVFPGYRCVLRRGMFWYYLEDSVERPEVQEETRPLCSPIYDQNRKGLLFNVTYYRCRINVEIYHALTDGTGALQFLRVLVYHYLLIRHADRFAENAPVMDYDASATEKMNNSFQKYYTRKRKAPEKAPNAYHLRGPRVPESRVRVIEGVVPVKAVLQKAHEYGTTLTVLCAALLMCAIEQEMMVRYKKRPVVLAVPINLRNYFPSESARNFFSIMQVRYNFKKQSNRLEDVIQSLNRDFERELTQDKMEARLCQFVKYDFNPVARIAPLVVKDFGMRIGYELAEKKETAAISNVGKIQMPPELAEYIRLFDVFVSTDRLQICMCSFGDNLTISFTTPLVSTDIQKHFFRALTGMGIPVEITASRLPDEEGVPE